MTIGEAISLRIDELLAEQQITQYRLAVKSGVSAQEIDNIRKQRNKMTAVNIIYEIALGFGMSLEEFFNSPMFQTENLTD